MANPNYVLLERITVGAAGAASVTFNSIPQTGYTDLKIVWSVRTLNSAVNEDMCMRFNGSSASYSNKQLYGSGSAAASNSPFTDKIYIGSGAGNTATSNSFSNCETYIPNYTSSNYKSVSTDAVQETNASAAYMNLVTGLWSVTSAITTINIFPNSGSNFIQYSTFSLYALAAVGTTPTVAPYASGGDVVTTDGTYWYHAFLNSGYFTPNKALSCDVLVVAGGGAGGLGAGGGGAGGVLAFASQSLTTTANTVTVGAGGASLSAYANPNNGTNSTFAALTTAVGGGGGGGYNGSAYVSGNSGGSGGGSGWGIGGTGGTGTSGQGNNGGLGYQLSSGSSARNGGSGGGAGAAASNGSSGAAATGGAGVNTVTNWGSLSSALTATGLGVSGYIAGGGGGGGDSASSGGTGGSGGGGAGGAGSGANGTNGTANTGSGGGGGGGVSGSGGSGLVIVRYAV